MSGNGYSFTTRKAVLATISSLDVEHLLSYVRLVDERRGWMASHRVRAARLIARLSAGPPSPEDLVAAASLMKPYARTISRVLREREIAEGGPEIAARAAVFGVLRPLGATEATTPMEAASATVIDMIATEVSSAPPKRRPGRPKGSRNRVREEEPAPKRRGRRS